MTEDKPNKSARLKKLILFVGLAGILTLGLLYALGLDLQMIKGFFDKTLEFLKAHPALIFLGLVILPGFPFPVSALWVAAGGVYGQLYGTPVAVLLSIVAICINITWTYLFARGPARHFLQRVIENAGYKMPEVLDENALRVAIIVRVTPGIPLFVQNYLLGLANIPFRTYLPVSILFQALWTTGFVVFGEALLHGNIKWVVGAIGILVAVTLGTKALKVRMDRRAALKESIAD